LEEGLIQVNLKPDLPGEANRLRWSPKGEKLDLSQTDGGLVAELYLGREGLSPILLRLSSSTDGGSFDQLELDLDRDRIFGGTADTLLTCKPSERRGKIWSSFSGIVTVPFEKMNGQKAVSNPYPLALWYVFDPLEPEADPVIRFSRRGWMEGTAESDFGTIRLLLTERTMDGIFDRNDSWAISMDSSSNDLFNIKSSRDADNHAWLGEQAFGIDSLIPSGRVVWIKPVDPQITRAEEEAQNDWLAKDRAAKRTGRKVAFLHDYKKAISTSRKNSRNLFIDFETTWCGPCKTMDQWVYSADTVVDATKGIVCVKIDGDDNRDLVKKYEVTGYPTLILVSPSGEILKKVAGYQSVEKMIAFLK